MTKPTTDSGMTFADAALQSRESAAQSPDAFVSVCSEDDVLHQVSKLEQRLADGADQPLAGRLFCVKDNIHVATLPTTCNCPDYKVQPEQSAVVVKQLQDAGAILIGKNTMDQFATGLNGTRSPEPLCKNAINADLIPGGSSSGSAVAVARGITDFALGSDTGGSGRVPAAANGLVGLKPTPGIISGRGLVYCNRSFDVIPVFAKTLDQASEVFEQICGADVYDPFAYHGAVAVPSAQTEYRFAVPASLDHFGDDAAANAHSENLKRLQAGGGKLVEIDFAPFAEVGRMVFESPLVAERLLDYGDFIEGNPDAVVGAVSSAINAGRKYSAVDLYKTLHRLAELKLVCSGVLRDAGADAIVLPTVPRLFTVDEMLNNPMRLNTIMGTYTYFANPLGYCALAVPGVTDVNERPTSLCFVGVAGHDHLLFEFAKSFGL